MRTPIPWMFQSTCSLPPDRSLLRRSEAPWIPRCSQGGLERSKEALEARQGQPAICARTWCSHSLTLMLSVLWCLCKSVNSTFDIIWYDHTSYDMTIRSHATVFYSMIQVDDIPGLVKCADGKLAAYKSCKDAGQLNWLAWPTHWQFSFQGMVSHAT